MLFKLGDSMIFFTKNTGQSAMAMYRVEVVTDDMEDVFDHVAKIATEVFCAVDVDVGVLVTKEVDDKFFDVNSVETGYV